MAPRARVREARSVLLPLLRGVAAGAVVAGAVVGVVVVVVGVVAAAPPVALVQGHGVVGPGPIRPATCRLHMSRRRE